MTEAELDELLSDCPVLFHMAEAGSWSSIRRHGLLSTQALLDLFAVEGGKRETIEARRRPQGVVLEDAEHGRVKIRDNKPINDKALEKCLEGGLSPADWYRMLNARVFFWLSPKRLGKLLGARAYAGDAHDILELEARPLVEACRDRITLSPINSGATGRFPVARGLSTFLPIAEYPYAAWRRKRTKGERVVELAVSGGVPDVERFVRRVVRRQKDNEIATIFVR